jgi:hypothetical protein
MLHKIQRRYIVLVKPHKALMNQLINQSTTKNVKEDLQKLEDKINMFDRQKGVLIHDIKYEKIQKDQIQHLFTTQL